MEKSVPEGSSATNDVFVIADFHTRAQERWRTLDGSKLFPDIINVNFKFEDGRKAA